mmetsp:Transcript_15844/g.27911  ORF Transcript_15844/g.27911 Transcript_15844/m.27911 type:complete len:89 (+) Transcript_15844:461-727(+)
MKYCPNTCLPAVSNFFLNALARAYANHCLNWRTSSSSNGWWLVIADRGLASQQRSMHAEKNLLMGNRLDGEVLLMITIKTICQIGEGA